MVKDFARVQLAGSMALVCLSLAPVVAVAQAWLPDKGSASFSLAYSNTLHKKHYTADGTEIDVGHTSSEIVNISGSYSPDRSADDPGLDPLRELALQGVVRTPG